VKHLRVMTWIDLNPRKLGSLEEYCLFLSEELRRRGHSSILAFSQLPPDWLRDQFRSVGAETVKIDQTSLMATGLQLIRIIREFKVDIIHCTFLEIFSPLNIFLRFSSLATVMFSDQLSRYPHNPPKSYQRVIRYVKNRLLDKCFDLIIADSEYLKRSVTEEYYGSPGKVILLYNGVNLDRFKPDQTGENIRKEFRIPSDASVVTAIAAAIPEKGLDVYLRAAQQVIRRFPKALFFVVGDGPILPDLRRMAKELGIDGQVVFAGLRNDTHEILAVTEIAVLLSRWGEAFSFAMLEAMASGKPLVASRIGAIPEAVDDGRTGVLVPPDNDAAVADAIIRLLSDPGLTCRMGRAARDKCEKLYDLRAMVKKTVDIYEGCHA
jgi:glycosyltransferase involved in cell wall biosynthesis